jgi:predicted nucleic acid-binding protein
VIVLDTNVLSALMQARADPRVVAWLDDQPAESIWITSVTVFEVRFGIDGLVPGRRRRALEDSFATAVRDDLGGRVLPFDETAARTAGAIAATERRAGRPIEIRDVQIAGIVAARKATLATRSTRHFKRAGISLVDPWAD